MEHTALDTSLHLKYILRCLRTLLPTVYTANDSTRMTLGCFIVAAIDLLSPRPPPGSPPSEPPPIPPAQRRQLRQWVLACQHPAGGFAGSPAHAPPPNLPAADADAAPGAANLAATFFALQLLALLADDDEAAVTFAGVDRPATLRWLRALQRPDGSFGEVLVDLPRREGHACPLVAGGRDMRYVYLAATVRWALGGGDGPAAEDIDVDALVAYIRAGQTYDGGFAESSTHESHAGYAFCAIAALSLLDRPAGSTVSGTPAPAGSLLQRGVADRPALIKWLASRQFAYLEPPPSDGGDDDDDDDDDDNFRLPDSLADLSLADAAAHVGFNGRCNKLADTCYCWWVAGTLAVLGEDVAVHLAVPASRRFLLERTQHRIGGFAKLPGGPPDIYHTYLGLAALASLGEPGLKPFDPALCSTTDTVRKMEAGRAGLLRRARDKTASEKLLLDMGLELLGRKPEWLAVDG